MRKNILLLAFAAIVGVCNTFAQDTAPISNVWGRKLMSLNGKWNYLVDMQEMGFYDYRMNETPWGFFRNAKAVHPSDLVEYDFDKSPSMDIPGDWNTADKQLFFYEGCVWFKRSFRYVHKRGRRALLYFGAVNYQAVVYVNGKKVGTHEGGFTPFDYDVTDELKDGENVVIVKVDNKRRRENVPTQIFDWWNYGGLCRDVMLVDVADVHVDDYDIQLAKSNPRKVVCHIKLNKEVAGERVTIRIPELKLRTTLLTNAAGEATVALKAKPQLWSPEQPKLYKVLLATPCDTIADEIGFRTIETRGKQILLNGKPIFLKGVTLHDEAPIRHGRLRTTEEAHQLLAWAKEMGCNFVRLAHYPHNEKTIREAERMGLMVWDEIPCYWTIAWENEATYRNAEMQLRDMIKRDRNRANVVVWSVANETPHSDARDRFLRKLLRYARSQDSTRLISLAMEVTSAKNYENTLQDNLHDEIDVVSFNQYVGWYRDINDAPKMKWTIPYGKPVVVSEFGGGALAGYHGDKQQRWTEEFQENLYKENLAMLDKIDGLVGIIPWILVDYYSPRRPLYGVQDWHNRKGLISEKGEKKKAFYVVQAWYKEKKSGM